MPTTLKIYLDYAATTPVDTRVLEAMVPYFSQVFGNPSSIHRYGQEAETALQMAREILASGFHCHPDEVVFTSCGTESDNLGLRGCAFHLRGFTGASHLLISPVEHHAVSHTCEQLARYFGFELEYLPVDSYGRVDPMDVESRLRPDTALVSVIYANNEIGTINPVSEIGALCQARGIPFHTDAVQAAAHLPVNVNSLHVDLMAIGAHKFYGPKGVGALFVRKGINLQPAQTGGGQEFGLRAGTHNIPYIVGMAEAFRLIQAERQERATRFIQMRDYLIGRVLEDIPNSQLTGHPSERLPNHTSFVFEGVDGNLLLMLLDMDGYACSSGSACKTGSPEPSEVLAALNLTRSWALGSLRVTLGVNTSLEDLEQFIYALPRCVEKARSL
jgi:cysteine desulfurase